MNISAILTQIDEQISKLQQARAILSGASPASPSVVTTGRPGRPKGSKNSITSATKVGKRQMTDEGRKRLAASMKRRWAAKKAA